VGVGWGLWVYHLPIIFKLHLFWWKIFLTFCLYGKSVKANKGQQLSTVTKNGQWLLMMAILDSNERRQQAMDSIVLENILNSIIYSLTQKSSATNSDNWQKQKMNCKRVRIRKSLNSKNYLQFKGRETILRT